MSSSSPLPPIPIVSSILGITFSALFSGGNYTNSIMGLPTLLLPPQSTSRSPQTAKPNPPRPLTPNRDLSRQFIHFFDIAKYVYPRLALASGIFYGVAAYYSPAPARPYFWGATVAVLSIFPFTAVLMPTNWKLMALGAEANAGSSPSSSSRPEKADGRYSDVAPEDEARWEEVPELMRRWAKLNAMRATIPLFAIGIAVGGLLA
ncbi:MAG: hypothetical protein Q9160_002275 [Pyrenula sp. 1 TL-2023]